MDEWKNIENYPNYMVSTKGEVKNIRTGKLIKPYLAIGYPTVTLYHNGNPRKIYVHRLVGTAFIDNPLNKPQINHKNGVRNDNRVENLEWVTNQENTLHSFRVLDSAERRRKIGEAVKTRGNYEFRIAGVEKSSKPVLQVETGLIYKSVSEAARQTGASISLIDSVCRKEKGYKTAKGYHWEFYNKNIRSDNDNEE